MESDSIRKLLSKRVLALDTSAFKSIAPMHISPVLSLRMRVKMHSSVRQENELDRIAR